MAEFKVAEVGDIEVGKTKIVQAGNRELVLCNVEGVFYAVDNVCTHDEGPLGEGELSGNVIECPRHGAQFDVRTGAVLSLPAVFPIATYPVKIEGKAIRVVVD